MENEQMMNAVLMLALLWLAPALAVAASYSSRLEERRVLTKRVELMRELATKSGSAGRAVRELLTALDKVSQGVVGGALDVKNQALVQGFLGSPDAIRVLSRAQYNRCSVSEAVRKECPLPVCEWCDAETGDVLVPDNGRFKCSVCYKNHKDDDADFSLSGHSVKWFGSDWDSTMRVYLQADGQWIPSEWHTERYNSLLSDFTETCAYFMYPAETVPMCACGGLIMDVWPATADGVRFCGDDCEQAHYDAQMKAKNDPSQPIEYSLDDLLESDDVTITVEPEGEYWPERGLYRCGYCSEWTHEDNTECWVCTVENWCCESCSGQHPREWHMGDTNPEKGG